MSPEDQALYRSTDTESLSFVIEDFDKEWEKTYVDTSASYVETMTLDPSAKIIGYDDLCEMARKDGINPDQYSDGMNLGSYAALKGYDAIDASGHGASGSYTVVLNRTKLIIKEP